MKGRWVEEVIGCNPVIKEGYTKDYLKAVFILELERGEVDAKGLCDRIGRSYDDCEIILSYLAKEGLVVKNDSYQISRKGRDMLRVVLTGGVFDIIHVGHLATLREAKALGDVLVIVIARDEVVKRSKGRLPLNDEEMRKLLVDALKPVDMTLLGDPIDIFNTVDQVEPDIIALGYDQKHRERELMVGLRRRGIEASIIRLKTKVPKVKTSELIAKIESLNSL